MKFRFAILFLLATISCFTLKAQTLSNAWSSGRFSYFTAGFAILFTAIFLFSYCFKTIVNQRNKLKSPKQILRSSLFLALALALAIIIVLYFFLNNYQ